MPSMERGKDSFKCERFQFVPGQELSANRAGVVRGIFSYERDFELSTDIAERFAKAALEEMCRLTEANGFKMHEMPELHRIDAYKDGRGCLISYDVNVYGRNDGLGKEDVAKAYH